MRFRPQHAALTAVADLIAELGADPTPMWTAVGLSRNADDGASPAPQAFQTALGLAARLTGREDFGLALARRRSLETLGDLAPLLGSAPCVGDAVEQLFRLLPYGQEGGVRAHIERNGGETLLVGQVVLAGPPALEQQLDHLAGAAVGLLRCLTHPDWAPEALYLTRRRPASTAPYESFFRAPVLFGQETTAIVVRSDLLTRPVARANLEFNRVLYAHLSQRAGSLRTDLAEKVWDRIWRSLGDRWPGEAGIAEDLGVPLRTLQRRLSQEGRPFRRLLDEARLEIAKRLMIQSDAPLSEISAALGYAEPAIFSRFFRRQAGQAPGQWRRDRSLGR
jgi:AraC-like DNA-binding protein